MVWTESLRALVELLDFQTNFTLFKFSLAKSNLLEQLTNQTSGLANVASKLKLWSVMMCQEVILDSRRQNNTV